MKEVFLASLRNQRNLTQRQLAEAVGFAPSAIAMYELGERVPSLKRARQIAKYFGVSLDDIIFARAREKF